ncbi:MAG: hypothetical protein ACN2B6_05935 [Rickettsiales bacterium]
MRFVYLSLSMLVLLAVLWILFPQALVGYDAAPMRILYLFALLLLVGSGITMQRTSAKKHFKNAAIWVAIIAGLAFVYELLDKMAK